MESQERSKKSQPIRIPNDGPRSLIADEETTHAGDDDLRGRDHHQTWSLFFPSSFPRANSFGNLLTRGGARRRLEEECPSATANEENITSITNNKWMCVSPMTHHIIRREHHHHISPNTVARLPKRRSRSFGDYIDSISREESSRHPPHHPATTTPLNLPTLQELRPPKEPYSGPLSFVPPSNDIGGSVTSILASHTTIADGVVDSGGEDSEPPSSPLQKQKPEEDGSSLPAPSSSEHSTFFISLLYGMINATIVIPVVMSFGNIIYQDTLFQPYIPVLIKLTMVSGVVHQLCFSTLSSLPFAVGSVQDAGLIFLSKMASDIVAYCQENGHEDDSVILATVTVGLAVAAFLLGCGLIVVGKLQLAGYVQMLPTCVVAGYLAFIGFFCGKAGLGLMAMSVVSSSSSTSMTSDGDYSDKGENKDTNDLTWRILFDHWGYVLPGVVGGVFIYLSVRTFRHVAVLPICIAILLLCFYLGLEIVGSSIEQATDHGWISQAEPAPVWYRSWDYLQLDKVVWSALPQLFLTEVSMLFVVALSSSLDVAAIELELARPLNYNKELTVVGISNVISGLTGGYTGSYIFSQSIFSLRSGIKSRVAGFCLAFCQILVIVLPFPILSFVPNFFYGSLLGMICLDLMIEWLWDFRTKVTMAEYLISLATFGLIQWLGVEYGILSGVGVYIVCRQLGFQVGDLIKLVTDETEEEHARAEAAAAAACLTEKEEDFVAMTEASPLVIAAT
jgi:MFS superfamily sulfate permease-like transporter